MASSNTHPGLLLVLEELVQFHYDSASGAVGHQVGDVPAAYFPLLGYSL